MATGVGWSCPPHLHCQNKFGKVKGWQGSAGDEAHGLYGSACTLKVFWNKTASKLPNHYSTYSLNIQWENLSCADCILSFCWSINKVPFIRGHRLIKVVHQWINLQMGRLFQALVCIGLKSTWGFAAVCLWRLQAPSILSPKLFLLHPMQSPSSF